MRIRVERVLCSNHLFRNLCKEIVKLAKNTTFKNAKRGDIGTFRKYLQKSAFRFRRAIEKQIDKRNSENKEEKEKICSKI